MTDNQGSDSRSNATGLPPRAGSVRGRTLQHMKDLLAKGAVAGTALSLTGCLQIACDPIPPPVNCDVQEPNDLFDMWTRRWAVWSEQEDGTLAVALEVWLRASELTFVGEPTLENATLVSTVYLDSTRVLALAPDDGVTEATVRIPLQCESADYTLVIVLDLSDPPLNGDNVPTMLGE